MKDTTGDIFQDNGMQAPFSMIVESAEMPEQGIEDKKEKNEIYLLISKLRQPKRRETKCHNTQKP